MRHLIALAGVAALAITGPAIAKPGHRHGKAAHAHGTHGKGTLYGYGAGGCPPGLAKKNNGCMPPGQAKKLYNIGQRFPVGYGNVWNYNQIPPVLRQQYGFAPNDNYYYGDGYIYRVDPKTMLIQQAVSALLR